MRQSQLFTKTLRDDPAGEVAKNAILLERGGFIKKEMAGVYSLLPLGFRVLKKIEAIIREEMNAVGGQEMLMPALHPIENYEATNRADIDVLFHVESATGKHMVLGQSHEEIVVPLVRQYVSSYQDLPLAVYQIQTKFRNELRAKSGIFRGIEFVMKDLYSFHADEQDFEKFYARMTRAYHNVFRRAGIGSKTFLTFASGGTFSKYSHEFQTLTDAGEDTIHLCRACSTAVNEEIIAEQRSCPDCGSAQLEKEKAIEVGNIFPLKTKFSDAFDLTYTDRDGVARPVVMGCYGIGLTRLMGAIVELSNDANGIIWPKNVAPYQVHLIALGAKERSTEKRIIKEADALYNKLVVAGAEVLHDDRPEQSAGEKFADSDLLGIPLRVVVSEKTMKAKKVEMKERGRKTSTLVSVAALLKKMKY